MRFKSGYYLLLWLLCLLFFPLLSAAAEANFLVISDIHLDKSSTHRMEINPSFSLGANDLDELTFKNLLEDLSQNIKQGNIPKPQFIMVLGDLVGHARSANSALESESLVFNLLKKNFPDIPILYTFGNNDSLKINYGPFIDTTQKDIKSPYEVAKAEGLWNDGFLSTGAICDNTTSVFPCLIPESKDSRYTMKDEGGYSAFLQPGLRFISLNSILFSPKRAGVFAEKAKKELDWLKEQLQMAKEKEESVLLAMHIPPGNNVYDHSSFWLREYQDPFLKIIQEYQSIIIGMLASHTHAEEIKVVRDQNNKPIAGIYLTPALSTSHNNAPAVKTFYLTNNNGKWHLSNYRTFYFSDADINAKNKAKSDLIFNQLYDFKQYYCTKEGYDDLLNCLDDFSAEKMQKYFSAGNPNYKGIIRTPDDIFLRVP